MGKATIATSQSRLMHLFICDVILVFRRVHFELHLRSFFDHFDVRIVGKQCNT